MSEHEDYLAAEHRRLQRAAYSRGGGPEALAELEAFERRLAAEHVAAAIVDTPAATSVEFDSLMVAPKVDDEIPDGVALPVRRRPWLPIALGLAVVLVIGAVVAVRPLFVNPANGPLASTFAARPSSATSADPPTVAFASYAGPATCFNLVDVDTISMFGGKGYSNISAAYIQAQIAKSTSPVYFFLRSGGVVCAWGKDVATAVYAYGHSSVEENISRGNQLLDKGYTQPDGYDAKRYTNGVDSYQFGDGFWAYSTLGTNDVLDQVIAHAPENDGKKRTDLQNEVYVTSEGLGDLRVGKPVPGNSAIVAWDPNACSIGVGAWRPTGGIEGNGYIPIFDPATADLTRRGPLARILIYSPEIPTKSGIRVGDSVAKVEKAFPGIEKKKFELKGTAGKIKFELGSVDPDHPEDVIVIAIYVVRIGDRFPNGGSDGNGSCAA